MISSLNDQRRWLVSLVTLSVVTLGMGSVHAQPSTNNRNAAERPVPVVVAKVQAVADQQRVEVVGSGMALRSATLRAAAAGEVRSLLFKPGQRVQAGQTLLQLDDRQAKLALQLSTAQVQNAQRMVDRLASTEGTGAVPGSVIDDARFALQRSQIEQAQARASLADLSLRAPFAGHVGLSTVDPGDRLTPADEVTTLDDRRRLLVAFELPEPYLARVASGHKVQAESIAYPGRVFEGRVTQIDNRLSAQTRTLQLRAELPNAEDLLRPGMSFRLRLMLDGPPALQVPDLALQFGREGGHVWVLRDGKAQQVQVRLVRRQEGQVLLQSQQADALKAGDQVVVEGVQRLRPGRAVSVVAPGA